MLQTNVQNTIEMIKEAISQHEASKSIKNNSQANAQTERSRNYHSMEATGSLEK